MDTYTEGYNAFGTDTSNPYRVGTDNSQEWDRGYYQAEKERDDTVNETYNFLLVDHNDPILYNNYFQVLNHGYSDSLKYFLTHETYDPYFTYSRDEESFVVVKMPKN